MKSVLSSAFILGLSALCTAKSCPYGNLPAELAATGNPQQTLDIKYPLPSWERGKKSYLTVKPGQHLYPSGKKVLAMP